MDSVDYLFETERLRVRLWKDTDVEDAFLIYGDPLVQEGLRVDGKVVQSLSEMADLLSQTIKDQANWPKGKGVWAIVHKENRKVIGSVVFRDMIGEDGKPVGLVEVSWHLAAAYWGHGYATEAAKAAIKYGFENHPETEKAIALCLPKNDRSRNVARRVGMRFMGLTTKFYGFAMALYEITGVMIDRMP